MTGFHFEVAYDYLRRRILSGELRSGQALVAEELTQLTGVSRTSVREALHHLVADGLVTIQARLGASVRQMSTREFRELGQLRVALEGHAAWLAAKHRTEGDLRALHGYLESLRQLVGRAGSGVTGPSGVSATFLDEELRFHLTVIAAARNETLRREILRLRLIERVVTRTELRSDQVEPRVATSEDHAAIVDAIDRLAAEEARQAMARHVQLLVDQRSRQRKDAAAGVFADSDEGREWCELGALS